MSTPERTPRTTHFPVSAEDPEDGYRSAFRSAAVPMWIVDADTLTFLDANDAALGELGVAWIELVAMRADQVWTADDPRLAGARRVSFEGRPALLVTVPAEAPEMVPARGEAANAAGDRELERSLSLLQATLDATADGILVVGTDGRILGYNDRFVRMWNLPHELLERGDDEEALRFVTDQLQDSQEFLRKVHEVYSAPETFSYDLIRFKDGRVIERQSLPQRLGDEVVGRVWSFRDVTHRVRAERSLRESRQFALSALSALSAHVAILDEDGTILAVNKCDRAEGPGAADAQAFAAGIRAVMRGDRPQFLHEYPCHSKTEQRWFLGRATRFPGEGPVRVVVAHENVTERKLAERKLLQSLHLLEEVDRRRRSLLARLVSVQEDERERIAEGIHDDSIQVMSMVSLRLSVLRKQLREPESLQIVKAIEDTVRLSIRRLRHLLFEVRPLTLERGLASALRTYLEEQQSGGGPEFTLETSLAREPAQDTRVILYRIAQEALTNARKHARATLLMVELEERDDGFLVRIADDGIGFDPRQQPTDPKHLGIHSMWERAEMAGGWWRVESEPGAGTTVEFWIPDELGPVSPAQIGPATPPV